MVVGGPFVSLRGFATSRPPLLVFTLCLTAFALTTLWLSYFVRNENELQNIDAHRDWKSLIRYLSAQELCIQHSSSSASYVYNNHIAFNNDTLDYANVSVHILATLNVASLPPNISYVNGYLLVSDTSLGISFNLDNVNVQQNSSKVQDVCVTLTGPKTILSMASSPPACAAAPSQQASGILVTRAGPPALGERVDAWCTDGVTARLSYKINPENSVVLSITDRSIINLHLVHTSYFLFVMAITLICYAVIRGKPKNKLSIDKVLLDT
ncbi:transmembrane protein 248-like isoform X2 [Chrysoperla carnea]|uniref:transmembrane protein 248-like isoform X2 n=1 Tax=Chrysoperla carnea TaxID=189513 RepID=UPI001D065908|nr:transmembrane protein 248-like isoform X2 [Chrysoperla carnea]